MCVKQVPGHLSYTPALVVRLSKPFISPCLFLYRVLAVACLAQFPWVPMPLFKHSDVDALHVQGPKFSSDPAAWLHPTLRAHMSCASHKGPLTCLQHGRTDQHSKRSLRPLHQQFAISRADPKSARPHRAQSSRELHRADFKCSLSPSVSLLTCKMGRCAVFGMDSVRGVHSVMRVEFQGQSQMLNTRWLCGLWSCKKT